MRLVDQFAVWCIWVLLLCSMACTPMEDAPLADDKPLAKVFNKSLYSSDLEGMFPEESSIADSALIVNAYVERWVRESLLMHEAEKNIPQDLDIDQLVRDYRASLVRYNYEKLLVDLQLDSVISNAELQTYYENNKDKYQLESSIARSYFIKVPLEANELDDLKGWWKKSDEESYLRMVDYCTKYAEVYMLEESSWYKIDDIISQIPNGKINRGDIREGQSIMVKDDRYQYFLKVFETTAAKNSAPLAYVKDQISQLILHNRKIKLITEKKEEIYDREVRRNNIQIFNQ